MPNIFPNNNNEGSTGGYTPWQLGSNLALWVRADQNVTTDSSNLVSSWNDLSGYGHNFTSSGANRPTLLDGYVNNKPAIRFNGINSYMTTGAISSLVQPLHYFFAVNLKPNNNSNPHRLMDGTGSTNLPQQAIIYTDATNIYLNAGLNSSMIATSPNTWCILDCCFNATSSTLGKNGGSTITVSAGTHNPDGILLGAYYTLGDYFGNFDIAEFMIFNKSLSTSERFMVSSYLCSRYGISKS